MQGYCKVASCGKQSARDSGFAAAGSMKQLRFYIEGCCWHVLC